jgi:DNA-binding SARP family transcriptional activator
MFTLKTLGGLWLEQEDTSVIDLRGRWLALLAMIAAGERGGASRDHIIATLWPELDQIRASHNLSQLLYSIRKAVNADVIMADSRTLRFDNANIRTDLEELQLATRDSNSAEVSRLYNGPFLSGFFLEHTSEFERWCEETRARIAREAEHAIEQYAEQCDRTGESSLGRAVWRRLSNLDPMNSRFAYHYVLALAKSGDRGGAVRHGREHTATLKEELGSAPPTRLTELLDRLQRGTFVSTQREDHSPKP